MKHTKSNPRLTLGNRLKLLREEKGMTINFFAYENDLTSATVSRIENGLVDTKISNIIKYAKGLKIPVSRIFLDLKHYDDFED